MAYESKGPLSRIVLDEIALEGLEGITIPSLWAYLANALELSLPLVEQLQTQVWSFILKAKQHLNFYELPEERPVVKLYNRFANLDPLLGIPVDPDVCPFMRYKCVPIQDGNIMGSCETYKTRRELKVEEFYECSVEDVLKNWGNKFVIVASQDLRYNVLTPVNITIPKDMTSAQYCILEVIGRSRYNGETTAGNWSLQDYCKEATIVFYIKTKLVRFGLVACQSFTEKRNDRLFMTSLLTLPRFYLMHKSIFNSVLEKLIEALKKSPKNRITVSDAHKYFSAVEKPKAFRKVVMTHEFQRIFEIVNLPIHEVTDIMNVPKNAKKERMIQVLQLRNPNITFEEVFAENDAEEKEETADFYSEKHSFVDMPVQEEFYRAIERHGNIGCSHTDICNYTGMHHYTVRHLIKKAIKDGLITSYNVDVGRQRTNMYVTIQYLNTVKAKKNEKNDVLKNMQCSAEPNIVPTTDIIQQDIPAINARVKVHEFKKGKYAREATTRQLQRRASVVKTIDERCIMMVSDLRHIIQINEKANGYTDEVCPKSVRRLLANLIECDIVKAYEIVLQCEDLVRIYHFVTHPKIEPTHEIMQKEIIKLKNNLFLIMEERRVRMRNKVATIKSSNKIVERKELLHLNSYKSPKFLVSRHLHEFLFYLTYELKKNQKHIPITEKLIEHWKQDEPNLEVQEFFDSLTKENSGLVAYKEEINWRTFIPPLPKYEGKPSGWFLFLDAIDRIPLSLFNKVFRINKSVDERITEHLNHPIRQHYLIKQLPCDMQCCISRTRLQAIYTSILKLLNNMGLVQVSERTVKDPLQVWIYLNKRAQILDTTTSEPSYSKVNADRTYTPMNYDFKRFDDVVNYWTMLQHICVHTPLGFRKGIARRKPGKNPEVIFISTVDFEDAERHDVGTVPGDRLGAAGLSSHLFAHTFRNWSWIVETKSKPKPVRASRILHNTPRYKVSKLLVQSRKNVQLSNKLSVVPLKRLQVKTTTKRTVKYVKKQPIRDAIDRDALKNMRTLRVSWRKEEDEILKMARATYMFIGASTAVFNLIDVAKICRDVLRHTLGIYNKTSQAVTRRGTFMIKMNRHLPEVPAWLHFLQTNEDLQNTYGEDITTKLRKAYPNKNEFFNALKIHFILILVFLYKYVKNNGEIIQRPHFLIPDSVTEFEHKFKECTPVREDRAIQYLNPDTNVDLQIITVISVLHSSLCCSRDKTLYNLQAFEIYKHFSEEVLNAAFKKARSNGLIVAIKRKNMHVAPSHLAGPAYIFSQKYRFRLSYLKIPYSVYDVIFPFYSNILKLLFGEKQTEDADPYLELKSPNAGHLLLISEGLATNRWHLNFKLPINILTVDANQRQTVSSMDRILDHFHSILDNAPSTEYSKQLDMGVAEKEIRIKFHPANLSYKIYYTPYDIISKLPSRYLHFFCALDHLNQEVDINFSKLQHKDNEHDVLVMECPFSCVMKHSNYINAIERIVQEKKMVLRELQEMPPQKLLNLATTASTVIVQTSNLLTLVRMLESFWREKELQLEKKDLGKISATLKSNKCINWHQLCGDILEYSSSEGEAENNDEYEPQLNKEERIMRAQDVFVVNLPTLQLSTSKELRNSSNVVSLGEINVPKSLAKTIIQKEAILEKVMNESHWKYTDNTLETLEPILRERNFSVMEQQHLQEIHNYIQDKKLGVSAMELMKEFPYKFLFRALRVLSEFFLIKRVGVSTFIYVHKLHIRPWVVHTFHIKRLQRENLGSTSKVVKRKHEKITSKTEHDDDSCDDVEDDDIDVTPSTSKKAKLSQMANDDDTPSTSKKIGKRISKATKRFESGVGSAEAKNEVIRDVVVMKPQPWMRLNGSLNRRVLDKWIGSILIECISKTGCFVHDIFLRFPHMLPADIMFLLELLFDLECIHLKKLRSCEANLSSEYEFIEESYVCENELYNPAGTFVIPQPDALTKLAIFIGNKKYNADFF